LASFQISNCQSQIGLILNAEAAGQLDLQLLTNQSFGVWTGSPLFIAGKIPWWFVGERTNTIMSGTFQLLAHAAALGGSIGIAIPFLRDRPWP